MASAQEATQLYRQLAEEHDRLNHPQERDRFLLLAADAAFAAGRREEAERFRRSILTLNPNHLLKPYGSLAEALKSPDILAYVQQLRRSYPREKAEALLETLRRDHSPRTKSPEREPMAPLEAEPEKPGFTFTLTAPEKAPVAARKDGESAKRAADPLPTWHAVSLPDEKPKPPDKPAPDIFRIREDIRPRPAMSTNSISQAPPQRPKGGWVGLLLCGLILLGGMALLGYVLAAPFLK